MLADVALSEFPESWELTTLGEVVDACGGSVQTGPFGSQLHASDYVNEGIPSVMPKNIAIEGIVEDDIARITKDDATRLKKYLLEDGDIVYSRRGDVEKCALVKPEETGWLCGTGCLRVRLGKSSKITPEFLHAYLSSPAIREWISRNAIGATMPNLNTSILRDVPVLIPEAKDVDFISSSWHVFNSKIQLNRQTNQTLENMAQALFKSWFVDFDPVIDNGLAAGSIIPEPLQKRAEQRRALRISFEKQGSLSQDQPAPLPETIRQLFPASFVFDAEMGWIPEGWEMQPLSNIAALQTKSAHPAKEPETLWTHFSIPAFDEKNSPTSDFGCEIKSGKYKVPKTAVLASKLNPDTPRVWLPEITDETNSVCSTEFMPFVPLKDSQRAFLYALLCSEPAQTAICNRATGSTGSRQRVKPKEIAEMPVLLPVSELMDQFSFHASALYQKVQSGLNSNIELAKLRDTLLPKLISGELRIPEAQQQTEAAVA